MAMQGNILEGVDTDAFSASLGLAVAPAVPVVAVSGKIGEDSTHKVKNVNRSLDRLKKQIKAAKDEKRLAAQKQSKPESADSDSEEDSGDEFLVVKKSGEAHGEDAAASMSLDDVAAEAAAPHVKPKKVKPLKIRQDGESTASVRAGAKRIAFDDSGAAIDPLQRIGEMTQSTSILSTASLQSEITDHIQKTRQVIDAVRKEDNARERERVREKHLKKKRRANEEADNVGDQVGVGGAFLMNAEEEDSDDNQDNGSGSDDDSDSGGSSDGLSNSDNVSNDEYESSSEDEDDIALSKYSVNKKRKKSATSHDAEAMRRQEEVAMKLLMNKL